MRLPEPPSLHFDSENVKLQMSFLMHWLRGLLKNDMITGVQVEVKFDGPGERTIAHNLGRLPLGWTPRGIRIKGGDPIAHCCDVGWDRQTISFQASGPCTLTAWVF